MFWKKKSDDAITIELDSDDRRNGIRIQPLDKLLIHYKTQSYKLIDISFIGLSFATLNSSDLEESAAIEVSLTLPVTPVARRTAQQTTFSCQLNVVRISSQACHCQFSSLSPQQQLLVDQFILNEQKRQILVQNQYTKDKPG